MLFRSDYCCVHGVLAGKECGYETIMINCNPETVSTDFDTADKLYFEPVFWEHIYDIIRHEQPEGVIVQLGGQTALNLAMEAKKKGIFGNSFAFKNSLTEEKFTATMYQILQKLGRQQITYVIKKTNITKEDLHETKRMKQSIKFLIGKKSRKKKRKKNKRKTKKKIN